MNTPPATIRFFGDDILALHELEPNETYVPLAHCCEVLGLAVAPVEQAVLNHTLLSDHSRVLPVDVDGQIERMLCLRTDLLPIWLAGVPLAAVRAEIREHLRAHQYESASLLWQAFRPQGFPADDVLVPDRYQQSAAQQAYVGAMAQATLARHQMLIEQQLTGAPTEDSQSAALSGASAQIDDANALLLARTVRRVAVAMSERSRRNEYGGIFSGLARQFGMSSYRKMPAGRLHEAMEWLERWHGALLGEPEPPPDI